MESERDPPRQGLNVRETGTRWKVSRTVLYEADGRGRFHDAPHALFGLF